MTRRMGWLARLAGIFALGLTLSAASLAQTASTTTVDTRNFEVISVDGNQLVFRDERGTNALTVPDGFRFTVDGKQLAIGDLKPGMKGTAVVTTTTTLVPVTITEIKKGVVLSVAPMSLIVKDDGDGVRKRFTQAQLNDRGIKILKDGRVMHVSDLKQGDEITATIVTPAPPVVVTEQEVQATLAQANTATPATAPPEAAKSDASAPATTSMTSTMSTASAPAMAAAPASAAAATSGFGTTGWLIVILIVAVGLYILSRRKKAA
jgi:hypothetical protein